ncbi:MAG: GNAT family N-acetyltransferase [Actinomycetota bacterium]
MNPPKVDRATLDFLRWVSERTATYDEAWDVWQTTCPRLSTWEDSFIGSLVRTERPPGERHAIVALTPLGWSLLNGEGSPPVAGPLPDVETKRLSLRRFRVSDLDELAAVFAEPRVWEFPYGRPFTRAETETFLDDQIRAWGELGFGSWAARLRSSGRLIGFVGLSVPTFLPEILPAVEVGWRLAPDAWGHGYATEGATAALDQAFTTLALEQVCSVPQSDNPASIHVADRLGMRRVRAVTIPANERRGQVYGLLYEINREEWVASR